MCKQFNILLVDLSKSKIFNDMCKRYGQNNYEDLKSEILSILLELPKEKKERIAEYNYLTPYALQTLRFQVSKRKWTAYRKKYDNRENFTLTGSFEDFDILDVEYLESTIEAEKVVNKIEIDMIDQSNKYFYHSRLLNEIILNGWSIKRLSREIGIPYRSVCHAIKEYRQHLKEWSK